jgi:outer membrane protein assembly factor BamE
MPMIRALTLLLALQLAGCGWLAPYRIDIQQGNFVSQEMVAQLKHGMTKDQVRFVLGTPLLTDIFHGDRWDYVYLLDRPGQPQVQRRLALYFEDDRLARLEGDVVAAAPAKAPTQ